MMKLIGGYLLNCVIKSYRSIIWNLRNSFYF